MPGNLFEQGAKSGGVMLARIELVTPMLKDEVFKPLIERAAFVLNLVK